MRKIFLKYEEIIKYLFVGGLTTVVSCVVFYGITWTALDGNDPIQLQAANVLQWVISTVFAYGMNRRFVFQSTDTHIGREFMKFVSSRIVTLLLDMFIMFAGTSWISWDYSIVKIISIVLVVISNYVLSKIMVFRKQK